eukprot:TRINITY_DN2352_c0_g1_i1.p1 TRINITY_DN2352_c0_g1~~TRINITY_DN2352_c0_g1_i1.p1  ORF type:complete len:166 (+),score=14.59 TRINITY_DN2352_c0_g1_i1:213-710(+)
MSSRSAKNWKVVIFIATGTQTRISDLRPNHRRRVRLDHPRYRRRACQNTGLGYSRCTCIPFHYSWYIYSFSDYVFVYATVSYGETASAAAVDWKQQFCTELDRHNVRNLFEVDCVQRPESVEESFAALLTMIEHLTDAYTEDFTAPGVRMHHPTSGKHLDALFMA